MDQIFIQIFLEGSMKIYNGIEVTENFYEFFAPYFLDIISHINDPREQDNYNLRYSLSSYLSVVILGLCQGARFSLLEQMLPNLRMPLPISWNNSIRMHFKRGTT